MTDNPHLDAVAKQFAQGRGRGRRRQSATSSSPRSPSSRTTEKLEFLADLGLEESGLDRTIRAGYALLNSTDLLGTAGPKGSPNAWTVKVGATAPEAAGVIHTDFQKGFIRAEVVAYDDFITLKGEAGAKEAGKWRLEGKDYTVADGDVIHFRFNV